MSPICAVKTDWCNKFFFSFYIFVSFFSPFFWYVLIRCAVKLDIVFRLLNSELLRFYCAFEGKKKVVHVGDNKGAL